jgi:glycosyltransferase involved in cell wall biosynthesis
MKDGVSVIICCYNSSEKIENVLFHIQKQITNGILWEVILVDNASCDNTTVVAQKCWTRKDVQLKIVLESKPGLSNARRKGLDISEYSIIVFVDDDNLISNNYISRAYDIMSSKSDVGLAGGLGVPVANIEFPAWFSNYQDAFAVGPQSDQDGYVPSSRSYLHGAGIVIRKSVWDSLVSKGFNFILSDRKGKSLNSGGDSEISVLFRLSGYKLWYDSGLSFKHVIPENRLKWDYVIKLSREFGKSFAILDLYHAKVNNLSGWERLKSYSWVISNMICLRDILKKLPSFFWIKLRKIEGDRNEFRLNFHYGTFIQRIKFAFRYTEIKKEICNIHSKLKVE